MSNQLFCGCCGGCAIASGGPEYLPTGNDLSLGTAKNNSKFYGTLLDNQVDPVLPVDWTGDDWTSQASGTPINNTDGWYSSTAQVINGDLTGPSANVTYRAKRNAEESGDFTYEWRTENDSSSVKLKINGVEVANHSENPVDASYHTESFSVLKNDIVEWEIRGSSVHGAKVGEITFTAWAASPHPCYPGDTLTMKFGNVVTFTFGIEDIRTYETASTCPDTPETTIFERRHYVTDGTRKFIFWRQSYYFYNENKADNDSFATRMIFPDFKVRDGFVEFSVNGFDAGIDPTEVIRYSNWIPYEYTVDGEEMTIQSPDDLRISRWTYGYLRSECDCDCTPFKEECPEDYTCETVKNWIHIPYEHTLSIPSITLPSNVEKNFHGCSTTTSWAENDPDSPPHLFYTKDVFQKSTIYRKEFYEAYQADGLDIVGGSCDTWDGTTCTIERFTQCGLALCPNPPYDAVLADLLVRTITHFPQQGQWICNVGGHNDLIRLDCDINDNCPEYQEMELEQNYYWGCVGQCNGTGTDDCWDPSVEDAWCSTAVQLGPEECSSTKYSNFSANWVLNDQQFSVTTGIVSELDNEFAGVLTGVSESFLVKGDRIYNPSEDRLGGGGIWEKDGAGNWIFKHQHHLPSLNALPDGTQDLTDLYTMMVGADQDYHFRVDQGELWGGTPPTYQGDDFESYAVDLLMSDPSTPYTCGANAPKCISNGSKRAGADDPNLYSSTCWMEVTLDKDAVVTFDVSCLAAFSSCAFYIDGVWQKTYSATGSSDEHVVESGQTIRWGFTTGADDPNDGVFIDNVSITEPVNAAYYVEPDANTYVECTTEPCWTEPEVQYGIGGTVNLGVPQVTGVVEYDGYINASPICSFDECDELPGSLTDHEDPKICGSWTQTITYDNDGVEESRDPATDVDDHGPWSGAEAIECVTPSYVLHTAEPSAGHEWFLDMTRTQIQIDKYDHAGPSKVNCFTPELMCAQGTVIDTCDLWTYEASNLWNREVSRFQDFITHNWSTYDAQNLFGTSDLTNFTVQFPKKWNDCWSDFGGPVVSWLGTERIDTVATLKRVDYVTVTYTGEQEIGGNVFPTVSISITETTINLDGISLTATPLSAHP